MNSDFTLGVLTTGAVNAALTERYGEYPDMFVRLLAPKGPEIAFRAYPVFEQNLPDSVDDCDAWLVTGSKSGVYDPEPWIPPLEEFLRAAYAAEAPMVGVCFGHQIMAQALGGRAEKSAKGWGCGVHRYDAVRRPAWMIGAGDELVLHAMHQDQVTVAPPDATLLARSAFCELAALAYGDPEAPRAVSFQPHPEFDAPFAEELVRMRRGDLVPADLADKAIASFGAPVMNDAAAEWIVAYLRPAVAARRAQKKRPS